MRQDEFSPRSFWPVTVCDLWRRSRRARVGTNRCFQKLSSERRRGDVRELILSGARAERRAPPRWVILIVWWELAQSVELIDERRIERCLFRSRRCWIEGRGVWRGECQR